MRERIERKLVKKGMRLDGGFPDLRGGLVLAFL